MSPVIEASDKRCLLLLHAFPCRGSMWRRQAEAVTEAGWAVLAPDLPGFGGAPLPDSEPSLDVVVDALVGDLADRGMGSFTVGGISLGGYLAMNLARRHPTLVDGLILCDTKATADAQEARSGRERLARMCEQDPDDVGRILEQAVLPGLLGDTTRRHRPDIVEEVRGYLNSVDARTVAWYQRAMASRPDSLAVLAGFAGRSLVVWGEEDAVSPAVEQEHMREALHGAGFVRIPGAGHLASLEAPEAVTSAILDFLPAGAQQGG